MNKVIARDHVIWLTTSSALIIYAQRAPYAWDVSSPHTIRAEYGMSRYGLFERPSHSDSNHMLTLSFGGLWMSHWDFSPSAGGRRDHSSGEPRGGCFFRFFLVIADCHKKNRNPHNTPHHPVVVAESAIRNNDALSIEHAMTRQLARLTTTGGEFSVNFRARWFIERAVTRSFQRWVSFIPSSLLMFN